MPHSGRTVGGQDGGDRELERRNSPRVEARGAARSNATALVMVSSQSPSNMTDLAESGDLHREANLDIKQIYRTVNI